MLLLSKEDAVCLRFQIVYMNDFAFASTAGKQGVEIGEKVTLISPVQTDIFSIQSSDKNVQKTCFEQEKVIFGT